MKGRVLKFRAWTGKQMIYQEKQYLVSFIRRLVPEIIRDHGGEAFSQHESYLPNGGVIDEYLMQFTGLQDKNGKDIYEGDVVTSHTPFDSWTDKVSVVRYEEGTWNYSYALQEFGDTPEKQWEIIGNIYEHPELIQVAE